jgi:hypothetical protein
MRKMHVFLVEEHHEVFPVWHYALKRDLFRAAARNTLLHVDAHADMTATPYTRPIPELSAPLSAVREFTFGQLTIDSFILPAVYQKLFYEICWLGPEGAAAKRVGLPLNEKKYFYARTFREQGRTLIVNEDPFRGFSDKPWQDRVPFCFHRMSQDLPFAPEGTVILDIDMDYFACSRLLDTSLRLEITASEFHRCSTEKYTRLLHYRHVLEERDGRFYIRFTPRSDILDSHKETISQENILSSVHRFIEYLRKNGLQPAFITLCRSRHSGFTPEGAWRLIEESLLDGLSELFETEHHIGLDALDDCTASEHSPAIMTYS